MAETGAAPTLGGWAGHWRGPAWFRVPGVCGCFGEHAARPPLLLLVLSLQLVLAGLMGLRACHRLAVHSMITRGLVGGDWVFGFAHSPQGKVARGGKIAGLFSGLFATPGNSYAVITICWAQPELGWPGRRGPRPGFSLPVSADGTRCPGAARHR